MPRKICVVITARASYARVRSVLRAIAAHPALELQILVAASALLERYGSADQVMEAEGFRINRRVYMIVEGENPVTSAKSVGLGLAEMSTAFDDLRPDAVVTIADRFETMATAVAAAYMNLPLAHIQGGEVTGSIDEKVRHSITKLADLHFVASEAAATRVLRMGERPECVFTTGCPSIDVARQALQVDGHDHRTLFDRYGGVGARLDLSDGYLVAVQHPVTTEYGDALEQITATLHAVADSGYPTLWFWPNVDAGSDGISKGIRMFRETHRPGNLHFFRNLPPEEFIRVLYNSRCIVGNSSVAIRECAYLGVPAINIGSRQTGRDRAGNVLDVPYDREAILQGLRRQYQRGRLEPNLLYGAGDAGTRIANLLAEVPLASEKRLAY